MTPTFKAFANSWLDMTGGKNGNPDARAAQPGLENRYEEVAGTSKVAQGVESAKLAGLYAVYPERGEPFIIEAKGRKAWALEQLCEAGATGCTPIEQPAPRWSAYVHRLRGLGVPIETRHEPHGGAFAGTHGRYILRARVLKWGAV